MIVRKTYSSNYSLLILLPAIIVISCTERQSGRKADSTSAAAITEFQRDVPVFKGRSGMPDSTYTVHYLREQLSKLKLSSIENGFDSLQIRVWLGHSMALNTQIVMLKRTNYNWSAQVVYVSRSEVVTKDTAFTRLDGTLVIL